MVDVSVVVVVVVVVFVVRWKRGERHATLIGEGECKCVVWCAVFVE